MRTAEEIQESLKQIIENYMRSDEDGFMCLYKGGEVEAVLPELVDVVKKVASEACREQREICAKEYERTAYKDTFNSQVEYNIENAPSPEMK